MKAPSWLTCLPLAAMLAACGEGKGSSASGNKIGEKPRATVAATIVTNATGLEDATVLQKAGSVRARLLARDEYPDYRFTSIDSKREILASLINGSAAMKGKTLVAGIIGGGRAYAVRLDHLTKDGKAVYSLLYAHTQDDGKKISFTDLELVPAGDQKVSISFDSVTGNPYGTIIHHAQGSKVSISPSQVRVIPVDGCSATQPAQVEALREKLSIKKPGKIFSAGSDTCAIS